MEGIELLWDVAVELDDAAGLAVVADVLARAGINVDSVCLVRGPAPLTCHLLVADGAQAADALARARTPASTREVFVCVLQNRPGTLAAVIAALYAAGVAVDLLYQATDRGLVIGADDLAAARDAVVSSGRLTARVGSTSPS